MVKLWEVSKQIMDKPDPMKEFDERIGGSKEDARRELLALAEFSTALKLCDYRLVILELCWDHLQDTFSGSIDRSKRMHDIPIFEENPVTISFWFEFEALVYSVASCVDRFGKVLGWTYPHINSSRFDRNINKLPRNSQIFWSLAGHRSWSSYLTDLRNTGLHRVLLSYWPRVEVSNGQLIIPLPDHECILVKESDDPRQFTFNEQRTVMMTVKEWMSGMTEIARSIFDDYFKSRER